MMIAPPSGFLEVLLSLPPLLSVCLCYYIYIPYLDIVFVFCSPPRDYNVPVHIYWGVWVDGGGYTQTNRIILVI